MTQHLNSSGKRQQDSSSTKKRYTYVSQHIESPNKSPKLSETSFRSKDDEVLRILPTILWLLTFVVVLIAVGIARADYIKKH